MKKKTLRLVPLQSLENGGLFKMKKVHVVGAVITNDQNNILCALRSPAMSLANHWEFPGGKIQPNETPKQALIREIQEELDCTIEVAHKITEVEHAYEDINLIVHLVTYFAKIVEGVPTPKEHAKIEWVSPNQLLSLKWAPADLPTIDCLMSRDS